MFFPAKHGGGHECLWDGHQQWSALALLWPGLQCCLPLWEGNFPFKHSLVKLYFAITVHRIGRLLWHSYAYSQPCWESMFHATLLGHRLPKITWVLTSNLQVWTSSSKRCVWQNIIILWPATLHLNWRSTRLKLETSTTWICIIAGIM